MIFRFEGKRQLTGALIWAAVLALVLWLMLYGFYPLFLDCRPIVERYIAAFPEGFATAFGFNLDDLFGFASFYNLVYLYEALLGAILAATLSLAVFGREKKEKCADFLMTKPVGRAAIFFQKLLCCLSLLILTDIPYLALYLISLRHFGSEITAAAWLGAFCLPLTQLLFLAAGVFAAVFLRRVRSAAGLGASIGMFAFLLSVVHSLVEKDGLQFVDPLFYFSPKVVFQYGRYDVPCAALALVLTGALVGAAYCKYTREDLAA